MVSSFRLLKCYLKCYFFESFAKCRPIKNYFLITFLFINWSQTVETLNDVGEIFEIQFSVSLQNVFRQNFRLNRLIKICLTTYLWVITSSNLTTIHFAEKSLLNSELVKRYLRLINTFKNTKCIIIRKFFWLFRSSKQMFLHSNRKNIKKQTNWLDHFMRWQNSFEFNSCSVI